MKNMSKVFFCVIFFVFQTSETAFGACPDPTFQVENLNMQKMLGTWYIIEESHIPTGSGCSFLKFKEKSNQFSIEKCHLEDNKPFTCFDYANLTISDGISAQLDKKAFSLKPKNGFNFHVITTDYNTYAGIQFCNQGKGFHTQLLMILSRNEVLNPQYLEKVKSKFTELKINSDNLGKNPQDKCPPTAEIINTGKNATESNKISFDFYLISFLIVMMFK